MDITIINKTTMKKKEEEVSSDRQAQLEEKLSVLETRIKTVKAELKSLTK